MNKLLREGEPLPYDNLFRGRETQVCRKWWRNDRRSIRLLIYYTIGVERRKFVENGGETKNKK